MVVDNCNVYILNSSGEAVEQGQTGQVFVAGAHIADGYVNGKEMAANFVNNTIHKRKGTFTVLNWGEEIKCQEMRPMRY